MDFSNHFNYSQIEDVEYSDPDSADESEIEDNYYATLGPSRAKQKHWLNDKDLVREINL
ncbi:hypothetical protein MKX03_012993, partial [Papaver bracteatum]